MTDIRSRSRGSVSYNKLKSENPGLPGRKRNSRKGFVVTPHPGEYAVWGVPDTTLGFDDVLGLTELSKALLLGVTVCYRIYT